MKERFFANPVDLHINILQKPEQGIKMREKSAFLGESTLLASKVTLFCGVFHEVKRVKKNPQFTFLSQNVWKIAPLAENYWKIL